MAEERPVEATDEALIAGSCKRVLLVVEGEVAGGAERVLAIVVDRVLADGAERDAPDDLVARRHDCLGREGGTVVAPAPLRRLWSSLQFFFYKHGKLKQLVGSVKIFIINNILNFTSQTTIKMTHFILWILLYPTTNHALLKLCKIFLNGHISLF